MAARHAPNSTAEAARACLTHAGWLEVGADDWSWTFSEPGGLFAARVTPFDPAYRLHAQACLDGPPNRWLPKVHALLPLRLDGYVKRRIAARARVRFRPWPLSNGRATEAP